MIFFNKTALHIATENNYYEIVKLLLGNEKINLTVQDDVFISKFLSNSFSII